MRHIVRPFYTLIILATIFLAACSPAANAAQQTSGNSQGTPSTGATDLPAGSVTLTGTGSTFQFPAQQAYSEFFPSVDPSVVINYTGTGSGAGKKAIIDGTVDFAGSDAVLSSAEIAAGKDLQIYPACP